MTPPGWALFALVWIGVGLMLLITNWPLGAPASPPPHLWDVEAELWFCTRCGWTDADPCGCPCHPVRTR